MYTSHVNKIKMYQPSYIPTITEHEQLKISAPDLQQQQQQKNSARTYARIKDRFLMLELCKKEILSEFPV